MTAAAGGPALAGAAAAATMAGARGARPRTMDSEAIERLVEQGLPGSRCAATDLTGTSDHWRLEIEWDGFAGLGLLAQHRRVMGVLRPHMAEGSNAIHAVQLVTRLPGDRPR